MVSLPAPLMFRQLPDVPGAKQIYSDFQNKHLELEQPKPDSIFMAPTKLKESFGKNQFMAYLAIT